MIDEGQTSPAPDILLFDHQEEKPKMIIEITHTAGVKKDCQKVQNLMRDYDVVEGFVYDYKKDQWYRVFVHQDAKEGNSFSSLLSADLAAFLK